MSSRKHQTCKSATIAQFLGDQLSGDQQEAFAQHLSGCDHCRAELESAAAEAHWWQEASAYLVETDEGQPSRLAERATVDFANTTDGREHVSGTCSFTGKDMP
jgi:hypothetical protein